MAFSSWNNFSAIDLESSIELGSVNEFQRLTLYKLIGKNIQKIVICNNAGFIINLVFKMGGQEFSSFLPDGSNFLKIRIPFKQGSCLSNGYVEKCHCHHAHRLLLYNNVGHDKCDRNSRVFYPS